MPEKSPIDPFLEKQGVVLLDGGLATELENRGHDLNHKLWSAKLLISNPDEIGIVHRNYLEAGADCIISASYQASISGFISEGISEKQAISLLKRSISIACEVRDEYVESIKNKGKGSNRIDPIVAASIGPYGAYLADGSEYSGNYGITLDEIRSFHEQRWEILTESSADLFACETIPSFQEAQVLRDLLNTTPEINAWISFSCMDYENINDGTPIVECASLFKDCDQIIAVGINCTAPKYILSLIEQVRQSISAKPIVVYPNSGEIYDVNQRTWVGASEPLNFGKAALEWKNAGASLIGGCCRIGPQHIRAMRQMLFNSDDTS